MFRLTRVVVDISFQFVVMVRGSELSARTVLSIFGSSHALTGAHAASIVHGRYATGMLGVAKTNAALIKGRPASCVRSTRSNPISC